MSSAVLADKTLVMIVGPSAIGKSTLMNEMVQAHSGFAYVHSFTTRAPREGEQSYYRFIDKQTAEDLRQTGQSVTYFEHPTTHDIYGTTPESYPGKYNLLDTLSGSVADYRELPFAGTITIALTAPAEAWRSWFLSRYPEPSPEAEKRLEEAKISITWALNDPETHWLANPQGQLATTAKGAIAITLDPPAERSTSEHPHAMLELIERGLWHEK